MNTNIVQLQLLLLFIVSLQLFIELDGAQTDHIRCPEKEKQALLNFRQANEAASSSNAQHFSTWDPKDQHCCAWLGIQCDKRGHVVLLDTGDWGLSNAKVNESLIDLERLHGLILGGNDFNGVNVPKFIGSFAKLRYLNVSNANFDGVIPHELGNLSKLEWLDSSGDNNTLQVDRAFWISKLTSLNYLYVDDVSFGVSSNWLQAINMLPSLQQLSMQYCNLGAIPVDALPTTNLTSLTYLDLSYTSANYSSFPNWLFNVSSLQYLYLNSIGYHGPIPEAIGNLTSLIGLDLSGISKLEAGLPEKLCNLCMLEELNLYNSFVNQKLDNLRASFSGCIKHSLQVLDLAYTSLSGNLPSWLGELENLLFLDISFNKLDGPIYSFLDSLSSQNHHPSNLIELSLARNSLVGNVTEKHFLNLGNLKKLDLKYNSLFLNISAYWIPPFQIEILSLIGCKVGPQFPAWLRTQNELTFLEMSSVGITDTIPDWFWNVTSNIWTLDLCCNGIVGKLPNSFNFSHEYGLVFKLSFNKFEGPLPIFPSNTHSLDVTQNQFQGPIPAGICKHMPYVKKLILSNNNFNGSLPSFCDCQDMMLLEIQSTNISGQIPACRTPPKNLKALWLKDNAHLSGGIPQWVCDVPMLQSLHLANNNLSGELPSSLNGCHELHFLDLSSNKFGGIIPTWLVRSMPRLKLLSLSANMFTGVIPPSLSELTDLQFLDLSNNHFSGSIPRSFGQLSFMKATHPLIDNDSYIWVSYESGMIYDTLEERAVSYKGKEYLFKSNMLKLIILIDLSCNKLSGDIPNELMDLDQLQSLNLSSNHLTGPIPDKIDKLQQLESLDLSQNNLSGPVPLILSLLSSLGALNLSYNNFSGSIPSGGHLDTFDQFTYIGNPYLCGFPLSVKCPGGDAGSLQFPIAAHEDEIGYFYLAAGIGFAVGIWMVFGLLFNKTLRAAYFCYVNNIFDMIYVSTMVSLKIFQEKTFKTQE